MSAGPEVSSPPTPLTAMSTIAMRRLDEETAANQRRYQVVAAVVVAALALVGALIALAFGVWPVGLGAGIAAGVLLIAFAPGVGERVALRTLGAKPADPKRFPRYQNLVEGLCEELGLPLPKLWVVDSAGANALALGRNPKEATVVVTTGLFSLLNRVELEGVLAAELSHIRGSSARLGSAAGWALGVLVPLRRLAVPIERHVHADEGAAYLTRYPPGLVSALRKLGSQAKDASLGNLGLNHLWIVDPLPASRSTEAPDRFFDSHPPLDERLENLREL